MAFLSSFWLFVTLMLWLENTYSAIKGMKNDSQKKYATYINKKRVINKTLRYLFLVWHSMILYPIQGILIALSIITMAFLVLKYHYVGTYLLKH